jgi:ribonuclease J
VSKTINESIKIIPLGGVGEIGKNMYVVEVDSEIFVIDSGLMFPENEMLGIDVVIPDIKYLEDNRDRVKGIFLTHGHEDALGALPYLMRKIKAPVYGTKLTVALAKARLKEDSFKGNVKFHTIHSNSRLRFETVSVTFFKTTHSIPDSVAVCIHTSEGAIVHTGEFKFDQSAIGLYEPEIGKMAQVGKAGVLCLLSDSTEAERPGHTTSESVIGTQLTDAFQAVKGRIIVASFASNLVRLQQVLDAAKKHNRKVILLGKSLEKVVEITKSLGYLEIDDETILPVKEISSLADHEIVILASGHHGEPFEVLQKMAKKTHKQLSIQEGDTVFITARQSPSNEILMSSTMNMLYRVGAKVWTSSKKIHVSGHGSQEDLKFMMNIIKPKFFIPVQGEYRMLKAHAKLAEQVGIPKNHIVIPEKGDVIEIKGDRIRAASKVQAGNVLIDGIGVGDVGNIVLRDRRLLSKDGIFIVVVTLNKKDKKIASGPEIISRGFVYVRESEKLLEEAATLIKNIVETNMARETFDWTNIKQDIRDQVNYFLYNKTKRRPMILPIIMEV